MRNLIYQFVDEHSEGEAVDLFCVLLLAVVLDDLRGHEPLGAAETLGPGGQRRPADAVVGQLGVDNRRFSAPGVRCYDSRRYCFTPILALFFEIEKDTFYSGLQNNKFVSQNIRNFGLLAPVWKFISDLIG